jgi:hypothetical protein
MSSETENAERTATPRRVLAVAGSLFALVLTAVSAHAAEQSNCTFRLALFEGGSPKTTALRVRIARDGGAGRVVVDGSGDYSGRAVTANTGSFEVSFATPVSRETITIGPDGAAIWRIGFQNPVQARAQTGGLVGYAGTCSSFRRAG